MPRALKVYGWTSAYIQGAQKDQFNQDFRVIVAATSQAEVARIVGKKGPYALWCLCATGNDGEIAKAMSKPGAVFACLDSFGDCTWFEVENPIGRL